MPPSPRSRTGLPSRASAAPGGSTVSPRAAERTSLSTPASLVGQRRRAAYRVDRRRTTDPVAPGGHRGGASVVLVRHHDSRARAAYAHVSKYCVSNERDGQLATLPVSADDGAGRSTRECRGARRSPGNLPVKHRLAARRRGGCKNPLCLGVEV